jgi:glycosyltransferase involved in cell wall biosynthesis
VHESFSLLLPVFAGDEPGRFERAFRSSVDEQRLRPDQVVIVRDGPVDADLACCIDQLRLTSPVPVVYVPLAENRGLGPALDAGLSECSFDVVARMDADDISVPWRFQVQLPLIESADIVGGGLLEFVNDIDHVVGRRVPPLEADVIRKYARLHDPFNHPTVVYRRSAVEAAGGYGEQMPFMEDYWLFARMLANGAKPVNVADPLVYYRVGEEAYRRRGGSTMLRAELALQRRLRDAGFVSSPEYLRNVVVRGGYRLVPSRVRRSLYARLVARRFVPPADPNQPAHEEPAAA